MSIFAIVPVKALFKAKTRLSKIFTSQERRFLTLAMLQDVLSALKSSKVKTTVVISSDPAVQRFAMDFGSAFLAETGKNLNQALNQATIWCVRNGAESVLVLPADLPLVTKKDINEIIKLAANPNSICISPSLNGGTNALLQTPPEIISPHFGSESFRKHIRQALAKHVQTRIYLSSSVTLDIDSEKDIERLLRVNQSTALDALFEALYGYHMGGTAKNIAEHRRLTRHGDGSGTP